MRNNIASFEKTSSSEVKFLAKFNAKINSALIFSIILTYILLIFSKKAILFLIYLLADKAIREYIILRINDVPASTLTWVILGPDNLNPFY